FVEPRSRSAYFELLSAPGVLGGEPYRAVPVKLRHRHLEEQMRLMGVPVDSRLARMIDVEGRPVELRPGGIVLSQYIAEKLAVTTGETLTVAVTEGRRPVLDVPVAAVAMTYIGSGAYMPIDDVNALLREGPVVSGANLLVDSARTNALYAELKAQPAVAGVVLQRAAQRNFTELMDQNLGMAIWVYTIFAGLIAIGVVYNSVRDRKSTR